LASALAGHFYPEPYNVHIAAFFDMAALAGPPRHATSSSFFVSMVVDWRFAAGWASYLQFNNQLSQRAREIPRRKE